jgi:hypothetical protein
VLTRDQSVAAVLRDLADQVAAEPKALQTRARIEHRLRGALDLFIADEAEPESEPQPEHPKLIVIDFEERKYWTSGPVIDAVLAHAAATADQGR